MYRKISNYIEEYLTGNEEKILCIDGARQVGKSYIIRELAQKHFENYIEINMADDKVGDKLFANVRTVESFYIEVSVIAGDKLKDRENTIIFIDEIQEYPELLTLLKPLRIDNKYKYICSGSELGITLSKTTLTPMGSIIEKKMYPMDFEEFLIANSVGELVINHMRKCFEEGIPLDEALHNKILYLFKTYLYVGGMPDAVKSFVETKNVSKIREIQKDIINFYSEDASKYDKNHKLVIKRIYDMIPSNIENKVKRIQYKKIENIDDVRYTKYVDEFEYLISSGIALDAKAVSEPKFPLVQSSSKNLIKLYMNDVGLLTSVLYKNNINAILDDETGVNLGAVYETVVAEELKAHNHELYYYDRKKVGEVDYLIDNYDALNVLPVEIKSGKDYKNFRALPKIILDPNYRMTKGYVFNNEREIKKEDKIIYYPIYFIMFI
ncbi:MAG: ATP-binding protein [Acholeplasmatales bacterium]|nr:ATP-binding protein [Acholeplasmatales bacterium]